MQQAAEMKRKKDIKEISISGFHVMICVHLCSYLRESVWARNSNQIKKEESHGDIDSSGIACGRVSSVSQNAQEEEINFSTSRTLKT
jgi:hypothetical protein